MPSIIYSIILSLTLSLPLWAADFTGQVVGVSDGDTITVMHSGRGVRIRLYGIDCPEKGQAFGNRAKQFTARLVFGKEVRVATYGCDTYGRTLGEVFLPDGTSLNQELVRAGYAWWFRRYSTDADLKRLETEAREAERGLWADPQAVPPWEWHAGPAVISGNNGDRHRFSLVTPSFWVCLREGRPAGGRLFLPMRP